MPVNFFVTEATNCISNLKIHPICNKIGRKHLGNTINIEGINVVKDLKASNKDLNVFRNNRGEIAVLQEGGYTLAQKDNGDIIESSILNLQTEKDLPDIFYHYRAISDAKGKVKMLSESRDVAQGPYVLTEKDGKLVGAYQSPFDMLKNDAAIRTYNH